MFVTLGGKTVNYTANFFGCGNLGNVEIVKIYSARDGGLSSEVAGQQSPQSKAAALKAAALH
jgi:hypothetical protein